MVRGTTVTWTNNDVEIHTVTSGNLETGGPTGILFESDLWLQEKPTHTLSAIRGLSIISGLSIHS